MIYDKTVFQTIFLSHLFVHSQDFLYCCRLMHKPRPQAHLKTPTNKAEGKLKSLQPANDLTKATGGKKTGFQVFLYFLHPVHHSPPLPRQIRPPPSQAMTLWGQSRLFLVPRAQLKEWSLLGKLQAASLGTTSLAARVSIPCIGNHQLLVLFSLFPSLNISIAASPSSSPPLPAPPLSAPSPPG